MSTTSITQSIPSAQPTPTSDLSDGTNDPTSANPPSTTGPGSGTGQKSDKISLSDGEAIGGAIGIAAAAAALGVGGTMLAKRNSKPAATSAGGTGQTNAQSESVNGSEMTNSDSTLSKTSDETKTRISPDHLEYKAVPSHYPGRGPGNINDPRVIESNNRYHPVSAPGHCAMDTLNMLVNGCQYLRTNETDYMAIKRGKDGLDSRGIFAKIRDGAFGLSDTPRKSDGKPGTITHPDDFAAIYRQNFRLAKANLIRDIHNIKNNKRLSPGLQTQRIRDKENELGKIKAIEKNYGHLDQFKMKYDTNSGKLIDASSLNAPLKAFNGKVIAVAFPMVNDRSNNRVHELHDYDHHYFTLEKETRGSEVCWVKRDSGVSSTHAIRKMDDKGNYRELARTPQQAIEFMLHNKQTKLSKAIADAKTFGESTDNLKLTYNTKEDFHVFIPR